MLLRVVGREPLQPLYPRSMGGTFQVNRGVGEEVVQVGQVATMNDSIPLPTLSAEHERIAAPQAFRKMLDAVGDLASATEGVGLSCGCNVSWIVRGCRAKRHVKPTNRFGQSAAPVGPERVRTNGCGSCLVISVITDSHPNGAPL